MKELKIKKLSVNETNDFFILECRSGIYGLIPKRDSFGRKTKIENPMEVCLYERGKLVYGMVHFRPAQIKRIRDDRVPFDKQLIQRASFIKELRLFLYKQTSFKGVLR